MIAHAFTALRLLAVPPFAWSMSRADAEAAWIAAGLILLAIFTDLVDGRIARVLGTASAAGRAFDHGVDFTFVSAGLVGLALRGVVPWLLPILVAVAFAQYVVDSTLVHRRRELLMSSLGRWNGILYFVPPIGDVVARLLLPALAPLVTLLAWLLVASTLASIADRLWALRGRRQQEP